MDENKSYNDTELAVQNTQDNQEAVSNTESEQPSPGMESFAAEQNAQQSSSQTNGIPPVNGASYGRPPVYPSQPCVLDPQFTYSYANQQPQNIQYNNIPTPPPMANNMPQNPQKIGGLYDEYGQYVFPDGSFYDIYGVYHPAYPAATQAFNWSTVPPTEGTATHNDAPIPEETPQPGIEDLFAPDFANPDDSNPDGSNPDGAPAPKKKKNGFKVTLIVMACVFGVAFLILAAALIFELFESFPGISDDDTQVNITVSDKGPTAIEDGMASKDVIEKAMESTVVITVQKGSSTGLGSGFIINEDGYIVTNYHVVSGYTDITVELYNETSYKATLVGGSERDDLAVIKITADDLPVATIGKSVYCYTGERVYAIGCPSSYDFSWSVSTGIISHPNRTVTMYNDDGSVDKVMSVIQTDAAVNHGNSGGPLINTRGEVIGIVTMKKSDSAGMGFAIPIDGALDIVSELIEDGDASDIDSAVAYPRAMIGISCIGVAADKYYFTDGTNIKEISAQDVSKYPEKNVIYSPVNGIYVADTDKNYNATDILQPGDIILTIGDLSVYTRYQLSSYINRYKPGENVDLTVYRNGETIKASIVLAEEIK